MSNPAPLAPGRAYASTTNPSPPTQQGWAIADSITPDATTSSKGGVQLAADLSGSAAAPLVVATHLAAPLPVAQGGTGAASLAAAGIAPLASPTFTGAPVVPGYAPLASPTFTGVPSAPTLAQGVRTATTTPVTVTATDSTVLTNLNAAGPVTVNLPASAGLATGTVITVKDGKGDAGTNNITINRNGAQTIDGANSKVLATNYGSLALVFDGANWQISWTTASEPWVAPGLTNSWVNFGASPWPPAGYYRDASGVVHLRGLIKSGASGAGAFTLPAGYRPAYYIQFPGFASAGAAQVTVDATGIVTPANLTTGSSVTAFVSLDGVTFRAEA